MSVIIMSVNRRAGGWLEHKIVFRARFLLELRELYSLRRVPFRHRIHGRVHYLPLSAVRINIFHTHAFSEFLFVEMAHFCLHMKCLTFSVKFGLPHRPHDLTCLFIYNPIAMFHFFQLCELD